MSTLSHLAMIERYVENARQDPEHAQAYLTWIKQACEAIRREQPKPVTKPTKMKSVRNLMSGKMIEIEANTPLCCDPSSETYWSM
jgi:hypothetical protein